MAESNIIIYQTEDGKTKIETRLEDETVWADHRPNGRIVPKVTFNYQ